MKKFLNFSISQQLGSKGGINPDRDWLILLIVFGFLTLITCAWSVVDYSYLWQVGDAEVVKIEIAKKTTINRKDLDQAVYILDQRAIKFDSLYKLAPRVVDPSL